MGSKHFQRLGMAGVMLGMLLGNSAVKAHPHYWIDVFAEWQFNGDGMLTGVKLSWLFDDYYSVLLVSDAGANESGLQSILENILNNTAQHHYFVRIEQQGTESALGAPEQARIGVQDHRIEIGFLLPMTAPLDPKRGDIVYRVAEPTYYFEMLHAEDVPAITFKDAPAGCRYSLAPPSPDAALVAYAASLGINESGGNELGIQFAETVTIRCE